MYNLRIIILAKGYKFGNMLLGKIFNLGIYNIITATEENKYKEELEKVFSQEGMSFGNSIKYKLDNQIISINQTTKLVKENYIRVKQTVSIGVVGTEKHIGATTLALNLAKYLSELTNIKTCYIENNNHNSIINLIDNKESIYVENSDKITFKGLDMFLKPKNMSDILTNDYNFFIYDYGALNEISEEEKMSFLTRDLKIVVSGNKIWEIPNLIKCFQIIGEDINTYLVFNFAKESEKETFRISLGDFWKERAIYSENVTDPFEVKNRYFFETILKPYLLNSDIQEKSKRFNWFKRKNKRYAMKKKSLYDIAMERKDKTSDVQEQIVIERKRTILLVIVDVIEKILKLLFYIVLFIFVTIGATVLINSELRWQLINMIKTIL